MVQRQKSDYWSKLRPLWWNEIILWFGWTDWINAIFKTGIQLGSLWLIFFISRNIENLIESMSLEIGKWLITIFLLDRILAITYIRASNKLYENQKQAEKELRNQVGKLNDKLNPSFTVDIEIKKSTIPTIPPHREVGLILHNNENHELTNIYIKLLSLTQLEYSEEGGEYNREFMSFSLDDDGRLFDIGKNRKVGALDKEVFGLAKIQDKQIVFLIKDKPIKPKFHYMLNRKEFEYGKAVWEVIFEIHGKMKRNSFRSEIFIAHIDSTRIKPLSNSNTQDTVSIDIGEIIHVSQNATEKEQSDS